MKCYSLSTVQSRAWAITPALALPLVLFGGLVACAGGPPVYSLEVEGYETYSQLLLPEEQRAIRTLIEVPSTDLLGARFWDEVTLCFSSTESALVYRRAFIGRGECPADGDFDIPGFVLHQRPDVPTSLVDVDLLPQDQRQFVWKTWQARDGKQTPLLQIEVQRNYNREVVGRIVSTDFKPGESFYVK